MSNEQPGLITSKPQGLLDVLDRVLDKGLVIVGDIKVSIVNVELLTLQIRLLICSIDKAEQIGISWWRNDPFLTGRPSTSDPSAMQGSPNSEGLLPGKESGNSQPQDSAGVGNGEGTETLPRAQENAGGQKGRRPRAQEPETRE